EMVVVSHLFLFYGKISGADVTWYESHLPLFGTIYFPIAPFQVLLYRKSWRSFQGSWSKLLQSVQ
ncbi:hypothetical protein, partial [[Clostridium] scindens]|uniref:hypothetical protein n=1 Tax=Clostridium scindens (strain JCM 10418 / VPI 12708) TaxID=29347 RepID=UPI003AB2DB43